MIVIDGKLAFRPNSAAAAIDRSRAYVYAKMKSGELKYVQPDPTGHRLILREDLEDFLLRKE